MSDMKLKVQIPTKGHHPANSGWFDTDKGNIYWHLYEEEWSCRDDRVSNEYPDWWLEDLNNVPQANELLPPVINWVACSDKMPPESIKIYIFGKGEIYEESIYTKKDGFEGRFTDDVTHWMEFPKPPCL